MEEILDVAIIEDPLQPELWTMLKPKGVRALDVITIVWRIRTSIFGVEEREEISLRIQHRRNALDHRFDQWFGEIVGNVPTENSVELYIAKDQVFSKKTIDFDSARLGAAAIFRILRKEENVFVIDAMTKFSEVRDVGWRSWSEIQNSKAFRAFEQTGELGQAAGAPSSGIGCLR